VAVEVVEPLERRTMMCAAHELPTWVYPLAGGTTVGPTMTSLGPPPAGATGLKASLAASALPGLPALNSLPGAPAAIYLDFNGSGTMTAYSEDADFTTFNVTEQTNITRAWQQMAAYFAPFNVNVTTVLPTVPTAWGLITNSLSGAGYSYVGVFPNNLSGSPQSFNPAGDARTRQSGIAHEIGHNFGLSHQSDYDVLGNKTAEYSSGYDVTHGPIMGVDYAQGVHKWFVGHSSNSPGTLQDDVAVIAGKIAARPGGGDGFRPDDVGNTIATATVLPDAIGGIHTATGVIERMGDADAWSFTAVGGRMAVEVNPVHPSGLIPKIEVYDAAGNLVAAKDDADLRGSANNDVSVSLNLPAGTYYAVVRSHGDYGDIGQYDVTATDLPDGWGSQYVGYASAVGGPTGNAGYATYNAGTGTFAIAGAGGSSWGTTDQAQLAGTTLAGDGSVTVRVRTIENSNALAKAGIMVRETSAQGSRLVTLNVTPTSGTQFIQRATAGGSLTSTTTAAAGFAPTYLRLVRSGNVFTAFRSTDGVTFTAVGSAATVSMASTVTVGLFATSYAGYATSTATFDNLSTTGGVNAAPVLNALAAPAALTAVPGTGTGVNLSWADWVGETGYAVERSLDGTDFTTIATTAANATGYSDNGLWGSMRYVYRVRAVDAAGRSAPSDAVAVVNRPNTPGSFSTTSWQTNRIVLNWRDVSGETGYRVERSTDGGTTFTTLATVGANIPSYTDATVVQYTQYKYRVVATSAVGDSPATAVATESPRLSTLTGLKIASVASNAIGLQWNAVTGATGYKIYRSTDGTTYSALTSVASTALTYSDGSVTPVNEYYYRVVGTTSDSESLWPTPVFAATPATVAPPAPWQSVDVGAVPVAGATGWTTTAGGTFTTVTGGSDIYNAADQMRFTSMALVGDGTIVARVATQENTGTWAKAGVMIRESVAAGARNAFMLVSPGNGTAFQSRAATGGATTQAGVVAGKVAPYWLKLTRGGDVFTGFASADGVTWVQAGTATVPMAQQVYVGLAADSYTTTALNRTSFDNVKVTTAPTAVAARAVGDGTVQRTMVNRLALTLTRPAASADAGAFILLRRDAAAGAPVGTGTPVAATAVVSPDGLGFTLTFPGTGQPGGSLPDGVYDWVINPALIRDAAGQGGTGAVRTVTFHRLLGDITGDRAVGFDDFNLLLSHYGQAVAPWSGGDLDGDAAVGFVDFNQLLAKYGTKLPADPAPAAAAPVPPKVTTPTLSVAAVSRAEGDGGAPLLTFSVRLSTAAVGPVTVRYVTSDGTAKAGSDYVAAAGTLTFAPGQLVKSVSVRLKPDAATELDESLFLTLSQPTGGAAVARGTAAGTIRNDD
jgi:regulation of enolase protein 1 (concanavalin A-like superfamily)